MTTYLGLETLEALTIREDNELRLAVELIQAMDRPSDLSGYMDGFDDTQEPTTEQAGIPVGRRTGAVEREGEYELPDDHQQSPPPRGTARR